MMDRNKLIKLVAGKWPIAKWGDGNEYGVHRCSKCGNGGDITERFCHSCGAFMENHEFPQATYYICKHCGSSLRNEKPLVAMYRDGFVLNFVCRKCDKLSQFTPNESIIEVVDDGLDEKIAERMANMGRMS